VGAAIERVDAIPTVDADGRDIGVELHTGRQLRPAVDDFVAILARAKDDRHRTSPLVCRDVRRL